MPLVMAAQVSVLLQPSGGGCLDEQQQMAFNLARMMCTRIRRLNAELDTLRKESVARAPAPPAPLSAESGLGAAGKW